MTENQDFEKAIESFSDEIKELVKATRKLIYHTFPNVVEVVWIKQKNIGYGTGIKKKTEHFCYIMPASKHVNLGFNYGAELYDPAQLLEGTGKLFRHYKVRSLADLENQGLLKLLKFSTTYRVPHN